VHGVQLCDSALMLSLSGIRCTMLCVQVEDIGPVSYCGGAPPAGKARTAAAAAAAGVAAAGIKSTAKKKV